MLPKPVSNIAQWIPSLLPRPPAPRTIPIAIAGGQGWYQLAPLKLVLAFAFDVGHKETLSGAYVVAYPLHGQHLFVNINARHSVSHKLHHPGGSGKRAATYIDQSRGLSLLPVEETMPAIPSITHAPDQTNKRPRLIHCRLDLQTVAMLPLSDFHKVSRTQVQK
jgi:hypothetical protein